MVSREDVDYRILNLDEFEDGVRSVIDDMHSDSVKTPNPGDHCKFCDALPTCPAQVAVASTVTSVDPSKIAADELGFYLKQADEVSNWARAVNAYAKQTLEDGGAVTGYKLVDKQSRRYWTDNDDAEALLTGEGIDPAQLHERKLISPAKAEKLLKSEGLEPRAIEAVVVKRSSGTTVVGEKDPRPAVLSEDFSDLNLPNSDRT